ncbi:heat shock protein17.2, partial [Zea mays]
TKEIHKAPSKSKVPEALLQSTEFCLLRRIELAASDDNVAREAQQRVRPLLDGPLGPLRHHVPLHRPVGDLHQLRDCRRRQEGGGQGRGRRRQRAGHQRPAQQGEGGQGRQVAPRRAQQWPVRQALPPAGERQGGSGEGWP